jgi:signal transduction histidine kinase
MDRANVLSGSAFRAAIFAAAAVVLALVVTGFVTFIYVQKTLEAELNRQIQAEQVLLREIYDGGGLNGLISTVAEINNPAAAQPRAVGLFDRNGVPLAGNVSVMLQPGGSLRLSLTTSDKRAQEATYYLTATVFDDLTLVIGQDITLITATERTLVLAFLFAGVTLAGMILLIGYAASRASLRKLEVIEVTMDRVSQGDTQIRLPISRDNDQIDRISHRINTHLGRLSSLTVSTRTTAAAIAHDLRTPLSRAFLSLQNATAQLDKGEDPREAIESTDAELARLGRIFDAILRISRIESNGDRGDFTAINLMPMLEDLVETFVPVAEEKAQELAIIPGAPVAAIMGDERMLRQMFVNLIHNAIAHCPSGTAIALSLHQTGASVVVVVADTGPGIPQAERVLVFEPFYRIDAHSTTEGSGLGLALVRAIADRHGIAITLQDNAPGLKVTLTFPA